PAESAGRQLVWRRAVVLRRSARATPPAPEAAQSHSPCADDDHEQSRHRGGGHGGHFPDAPEEPCDGVAEPTCRGPARLPPQPQLVLESRPRARGRERVVELALKGLDLELVFRLAHASAFRTASFSARTARG